MRTPKTTGRRRVGKQWLLGWLWLLLLSGWLPAHAQSLAFEQAQVLAAAGLNEGYAFANDMVADAQGNWYVTGHFGGIQHFGAITLNAGNDFDMYVAKVDASGRVVWAVQGGGPRNDYSESIGLDKLGNVYVAGDYLGSMATYGSTTLRNNGPGSYFVAKLSAAGQWQWAIGGVAGDNIQFNSLAVSSQGVVWLAGSFGIARPDAALGSFTLTSRGAADILVAQLGASGNWLGAFTAGGIYPEEAVQIALDEHDNAYLTGRFTSPSVAFDSHRLAHSLTASAYNPDLFVAKLTVAGTWQWAAGGGGAGQDAGYGIAVDRQNRVYLTGNFEQDASFGTTRLTSAGDSDVLTACLTKDGAWQWAVAAGGSSADAGVGVAVTTDGSVYTGGNFGGPLNSTAHFGATTLSSAGTSDVFVARLDSVGHYLGAVAAGGPLEDYCSSVVAVANKVYLAGFISSSINVSPAAQFGPFTLIGNPTTYARTHTGWLARLAVPPIGSSGTGSDPLATWDVSSNVPNIITPNGDMRNDTFAPTNMPSGPWELTIFSRWGRQVYSNSDYQNDWGGAAATGIYFYVLRHTPTGRSYKAWLEVVR